jgi:hypothetical protein
LNEGLFDFGAVGGEELDRGSTLSLQFPGLYSNEEGEEFSESLAMEMIRRRRRWVIVCIGLLQDYGESQVQFIRASVSFVKKWRGYANC